MKDLLKARLPEGLQVRARQLSRLRWMTKLGRLRGYGVDFRANPGLAARYLFLDPEVESHTYDLDNEAELAAWAVDALGVTASQAAAWIAETKDDPELTSELARRMRWRFDSKTHQGLALRLLWYVMVRARRPRLVIETGILAGLGSLVLLRALERNGREGSPGRLISFDVREESGWIVPGHLRGNWERRIGFTTDTLVPALEGREVDMLFHDTPHTDELQRFEFGAALAHAAPRLALVDGSGGRIGVLEELASARGGRYVHFRDRPRDHFYPSPGAGVAFFDSGPEPA